MAQRCTPSPSPSPSPSPNPNPNPNQGIELQPDGATARRRIVGAVEATFAKPGDPSPTPAPRPDRSPTPTSTPDPDPDLDLTPKQEARPPSGSTSRRRTPDGAAE
eukprot:scaffold200_cov48-Phaeocystis_antarctica.AAC.3